MKKREYDERLRELIYLALSGPLVVVIGMYVIGDVLGILTGVGNLFIYVFEGVGGVPLIVLYYRKVWGRLTESIS